MGLIDRIINSTERIVNSDDYQFEVKQRAQIELIQLAGGDEVAGTWIDANGKRFDELMKDPQYNFIERLAYTRTHDEALKEIQSKFYH